MEVKLIENTWCNVATVCADGSPWNTPLFFAYDERTLYWWSPIQAVHSQNIMRDGRVMITIYDSHTRVGKGDGAGLYLRCNAGLVKPNDLKKAMSLFNEKVKISDFFLSQQLVAGEAPTRLFQATIQQAWENKDGADNGYFVDERRELEL
jgi:hypothetical protein